jgi:hypothetical protein
MMGKHDGNVVIGFRADDDDNPVKKPFVRSMYQRGDITLDMIRVPRDAISEANAIIVASLYALGLITKEQAESKEAGERYGVKLSQTRGEPTANEGAVK